MVIEHGVRSLEFGVRGSGFGVRSSGFGVRGSGFGTNRSRARARFGSLARSPFAVRRSAMAHPLTATINRRRLEGLRSPRSRHRAHASTGFKGPSLRATMAAGRAGSEFGRSDF